MERLYSGNKSCQACNENIPSTFLHHFKILNRKINDSSDKQKVFSENSLNKEDFFSAILIVWENNLAVQGAFFTCQLRAKIVNRAPSHSKIFHY